ncbi:putative chaperone, partial [Vibrio parahaemolyticus V-223/04]
NQASLFY